MFGQVIWDMTAVQYEAALAAGWEPSFEIAERADGTRFIKGSLTFVDHGEPEPDPTGRAPVDWSAINAAFSA